MKSEVSIDRIISKSPRIFTISVKLQAYFVVYSAEEFIAAYIAMAIAFGLFFSLPFLATFFLTQERPEFQQESEPFSIKKTFIDPFKTPTFVHVLFMYLFAMTTMDIIMSIMMYFMTYYMGRPDETNYVLGVLLVLQIVAISIFTILSNRLGKRTSFIIAAVFWIGVMFGSFLITPQSHPSLIYWSVSLAKGSGALLHARTNYGPSIIPSLFGVELFYMDEKSDMTPINKPIPGGADAIRRLLDQGVPELNTALAGRTLECGAYFVEVLKDYSKLRKYLTIYHPDVQGPMDICELIWGSDIFLDIMDHPQLVHDFLQLVTDTYIAFMKEWEKLVPFRTDYAVHWGMVHKGNIMLRNDSAMNFSPVIYDEFIRTCDQQLLDEFGGGAIHFCGRGSHYIHHVGQMPGVYAVNLGQPEYNDMEQIYQHTVDQGINIIGLPCQAIDGDRQLHGRVHCW